jgi:hypothetical protein
MFFRGLYHSRSGFVETTGDCAFQIRPMSRSGDARAHYIFYHFPAGKARVIETNRASILPARA